MPLPYPSTPPADFGFGTAYERVAIYEMISNWISQWQYAGKTGIEGFYDGFTGLPGLHLLPLAQAGGTVTVACRDGAQAEAIRAIYDSNDLADRLETLVTQDPADLGDRRFDLALLFNPFPYVENWEHFLSTVAQLSTGRLVVSVANPNSYGALFRRGMKKLRPTGKTDLFDHPATSPKHMRKMLSAYGAVEQEDYFDCPWWPDLFVEAGDSLASWLIGQIPFVEKPAPKPPVPASASAEYRYGPDGYPYFQENSPELSALRQKITRHPTFDRSPKGPLKEFFAHHRIFVVHRPTSA